MTRRIFCKVLLVVVAIFGVLVLSGVLSAQGRSDWALEHVKEVQERNTERLMAMNGVEGTAIGYNQNDRLAVKVFTAGPGVRGIPQELEAVPVQVVVTGKFYALPKPSKPPGKPDKPDKPGKPPKDGDTEPPKPPTGLEITNVSSSQVNLGWDDNSDGDLSHYNVYRSITSGGPYSRIASNVYMSEYSNTGLAPLITYYYVVSAVDTSGNESEQSDDIYAMTEMPDRSDLPVPIGVSTGHPNITAGTIGCRVTDGTNVYALSNNHVYADENRASIGDNVLQPGPYDGGVNPSDAIGVLADFEPINFHPRASNTIDAAIALTSTDMVGNATPSGDPEYPDGYGTPSSTTETAYVGMEVQKYGRNGHTYGDVTSINATVRVGYSTRSAIFVEQIIIEPGGFSAGGDSGSLVVTKNGKNPVGLLFAGSSTMTVANPIDAVLERFVVTVDGTSP